MRHGLLLLSVLLLVAAGAPAQDPAEVDPDHYKVVFENEHVRVLLISYEPGDTSVMHYHPAGVSIFQTDLEVEFEVPDGSKMVVDGKAGDVIWTPAGHHLPTNMGDAPFRVYQIELKGPEEADEEDDDKD